MYRHAHNHMKEVNMLKGATALTLILLFVNASTGQSSQTAQDYFKSGMAHFQSGAIDAALADANRALELNACKSVSTVLKIRFIGPLQASERVNDFETTGR